MTVDTELLNVQEAPGHGPVCGASSLGGPFSRGPGLPCPDADRPGLQATKPPLQERDRAPTFSLEPDRRKPFQSRKTVQSQSFVLPDRKGV